MYIPGSCIPGRLLRAADKLMDFIASEPEAVGALGDDPLDFLDPVKREQMEKQQRWSAASWGSPQARQPGYLMVAEPGTYWDDEDDDVLDPEIEWETERGGRRARRQRARKPRVLRGGRRR